MQMPVAGWGGVGLLGVWFGVFGRVRLLRAAGEARCSTRQLSVGEHGGEGDESRFTTGAAPGFDAVAEVMATHGRSCTDPRHGCGAPRRTVRCQTFAVPGTWIAARTADETVIGSWASRRSIGESGPRDELVDRTTAISHAGAEPRRCRRVQRAAGDSRARCRTRRPCRGPRSWSPDRPPAARVGARQSSSAGGCDRTVVRSVHRGRRRLAQGAKAAWRVAATTVRPGSRSGESGPRCMIEGRTGPPAEIQKVPPEHVADQEAFFADFQVSDRTGALAKGRASRACRTPR